MNQVIYLEKNDIHCTLTTYLYCMWWMMWAAEQNGDKVYIHCPRGLFLQSYDDKEKYAQQPNGFEWYFHQPMVGVPPPREQCEVWTWEGWKDPTPVSFMAQPLSVIRDYYQQHLHFNLATAARGQALVEKYGINFEKTIGLSWRGTDVYLDGRPRVPIEVYFPFIDELLEKEPDLRLACTAEEETILDPLLARYPTAFKIEEFEAAPYGGKENPERFSPRSGYERGLQPTLMVWLFSKCKHYLKNRSSTGAVASWLSKGRIVNIFHPENLGFPANTNTIEINGQQYSTENKFI